MMKKIAALMLVLVMPMALSAKLPVKERAKVKRSAAPIVSQPAAVVIEIPPTLAEMAIAQKVYVGRLPCELGAFVSVTADVNAAGYFDVETKNLKFRMVPVETTTGAVRLEDRRTGAVWLQLANKSMLMNQKIGQRLADECMSPVQASVAELLLKNPAPSILEALPAVALVTVPAPSLLAVPAEVAPITDPAPSVLAVSAEVAPIMDPAPSVPALPPEVAPITLPATSLLVVPPAAAPNMDATSSMPEVAPEVAPK